MTRKRSAGGRSQPVSKGPAPHEPDAADIEAVRATLQRAARRLNILEFIILGAAIIASVAGGWLAALLAGRAFGFPFRATWVGASLALFGIPALVALLVEKRRQKTPAKPARDETDQSPEGDSE